MKFKINLHPDTKMILITGATASGKSDYANELLSYIDGEVINFDTGQFYRYVPSIVALPEYRYPGYYHLYAYFEPDTVLMAPFICELVESKIREINNRNRIAILVGCSGMYINALLNGLSVLPPTDIEYRKSIEDLDTHHLYQHLMNVVPERAAKINVSDRVRIERLMEIVHILGPGKIDEAYDDKVTYNLPNYEIILIERERDELYQRINNRVDQWFRDDCIYYQEVSELLSKYSMNAEIFKILGLSQIKEFTGDFETIYCNHHEELRERIKQETRRYAKRQMTYWRNQPKKLGWEVKIVSN